MRNSILFFSILLFTHNLLAMRSVRVVVFEKKHKKQLQSILAEGENILKIVDSIQQLKKDDYEWNDILDNEKKIKPALDLISDWCYTKNKDDISNILSYPIGSYKNIAHLFYSTEHIAAFIGTPGAIAWAAKNLKNKPGTRNALMKHLSAIVKNKEKNHHAKALFSIITYKYHHQENKKAISSKRWFLPEILLLAAEENPELLPTFLDYIDINTKNKDGETALMCAAKADDLQTLDFLLTKNPSINETDCIGNTALIIAAQKTIEPEAITKLIAAGADVKIRHRNGCTALDFAINRLSNSRELVSVKTRINNIIQILKSAMTDKC